MPMVRNEAAPDKNIPHTVLPGGAVIVKCRFCDGSGSKNEDGSGLCPGCNGRGVQRI